ncbi:MAG: carbonic anhydrase family protein [Thermoanaerobaculia bacterium]
MMRLPFAVGISILILAIPAAAQTARDAAPVTAVQTKASQSALKPSDAMKMLKDGNERFATGHRLGRNLISQVKGTAKGQYPFAAILSCMDSRAPAELVFDQGIGDVFSIRVAGNVVDEDDLGSLEYAAKVAGVKLIVVMGHSSCGAVKGAIEDVKLGNLTALLSKIRPSVKSTGGQADPKDHAFVAKVAEANVRHSMTEIREKSPILKELFDSGAVGLVGAMYDIETARVTFFAD